MQSTSQGNSTSKTIRISQSLVRPHFRNIAPAPLSQQQPQQQQQQQQQSTRPTKTLVLKTIPLKVKQVAPTTIKMPPRQSNPGLPHNIVHQQPTEVSRFLVNVISLRYKWEMRRVTVLYQAYILPHCFRFAWGGIVITVICRIASPRCWIRNSSSMWL